MKYAALLVCIFLVCCTVTKKTTEEEPLVVLNTSAMGLHFEVEFVKGPAFNHPSYAFWLEDLEGNYLETLYVTRFVATGNFGQGEISPGHWDSKPGIVRRPASLPYWAHKRNIKAGDGLYIPSPETPVPDALTSATPTGSFRLLTNAESRPGKKFRLLMEINQPWDSNKYWNNARDAENIDYSTSLQPALVYAVTLDPQNREEKYYLNPIGHSHPSGENGKLFTDLSTLTTAKQIAEKIIISIQ